MFHFPELSFMAVSQHRYSFEEDSKVLCLSRDGIFFSTWLLMHSWLFSFVSYGVGENPAGFKDLRGLFSM